MRHSIKELIGFTLGSTEGEIGKVTEFYFDDSTWTIRYLIVDTGNWLSGRVVLISPQALLTPDWNSRVFPINLSKDQIKNSPDINTDIPVSRQKEHQLYNYYPWVAYWGSDYPSGRMTMDDSMRQATKKHNEAGEDKHLRSTRKVTGYDIKAKDGKIGDVEDFLIDENWKIDFMLVDTGHWGSRKNVLISPDMIKEIDWETEEVLLNTTVWHIKNSPEYDPKQELTEIYTLALHDHYNNLVD